MFLRIFYCNSLIFQKEIADAQLANDKEKKLLQEEIKQLRKALEEAKSQLKMVSFFLLCLSIILVDCHFLLRV